MTEHEMKKLGRGQLLEILVRQSRELDRLQEELKEAEDKLADRRIRMEESGSIAEAALKLNGIFEAAQQAADDYLASLMQEGESGSRQEEEAVSEEGSSRLAETAEKCSSLEEETAEKCRQMEEQTAAKCRKLEEETAERCRSLEEEAMEKCRAMEEKAAAKCRTMIKQAHDEKNKETDSQETESPAAAGSVMDQYENLRRMLSVRLDEKADNE